MADLTKARRKAAEKYKPKIFRCVRSVLDAFDGDNILDSEEYNSALRSAMEREFPNTRRRIDYLVHDILVRNGFVSYDAFLYVGCVQAEARRNGYELREVWRDVNDYVERNLVTIVARIEGQEEADRLKDAGNEYRHRFSRLRNGGQKSI